MDGQPVVEPTEPVFVPVPIAPEQWQMPDDGFAGPLIGGEKEKGDGPKGDKGEKGDKGKAPARFSPEACDKIIDALIEAETSPQRRKLLTQLKTEKDSVKRLEILDVLINGQKNDAGDKFIIQPEKNAERLEQLKEIARAGRFVILKDTVLKTLPEVRAYFLNGEVDQERQAFYSKCVRQDQLAANDKLKELLKLEPDKDRQKKIDDLLTGLGDDRKKVLEELLKTEKDENRQKLLKEILKLDANVAFYSIMRDGNPTAENIKTLQEMLKDPTQMARLTECLEKNTASLKKQWDDTLALATDPKKNELIKSIKEEKSYEKRMDALQLAIGIETDPKLRQALAALITLERSVIVLSDLPAEEQRRLSMKETFAKAATGDPEGILAMYPYCSRWLTRLVPCTLADIAHNKGLEIPVGCPIPLPPLHGKPMKPELFIAMANKGLLKLDLTSDVKQVLDSDANINLFRKSTAWYFTCTEKIFDRTTRWDADDLVATIRKQYGPEGVKKYGPQGIPEGWMPPKELENIPAWRARVLYVTRLGERVRNYCQAFHGIDGIANSGPALEELRALGVEFTFDDKKRLESFCIPQLDGLDLRLQIPWNNKKVQDLEKWILKYDPEYQRAVRPFIEAQQELLRNKDPKAFFRHGDFPYNENIHPDIGVKYDLIKQRITKVKEENGMLIIEGTVEYQTSSWYSYNYWLGCEAVKKTMTPEEFCKINNLPPGTKPEESKDPFNPKTYNIIGPDGKERGGWRYIATEDGKYVFSRDETFRRQIKLNDFVPVMTAMGNIEVVPARDFANFQWWQEYFWHHGLKIGKAIMDAGMIYTGAGGLFAAEASFLSRVMSFGRLVVGLAGLAHHQIDKLPPEVRKKINEGCHIFILFDISTGLLSLAGGKLFGAAKAAEESAQLLNTPKAFSELTTLGKAGWLADKGVHAAMAVDGIVIYGPVVYTETQLNLAKKNKTRTEDKLDQARKDIGGADIIVPEVDDKPAKFDLKDEVIRTSCEKMLTRLKDHLATEVDGDVRARLQKLLDEAIEVMKLDKNDQKRKDFEIKLAKMFTPTDLELLWAQMQKEMKKDPGRYKPEFVQEIKDKLEKEKADNPLSKVEKILAAAIGTCLMAKEDGKFPETMFQRTAKFPEHEVRVWKEVEYEDKQGNKKKKMDWVWEKVAARTEELKVSSADVVQFVKDRAEDENEVLSIKMATAKMLWRMGKLDNHGLAGVLLEVVKKSTSRELRAAALIDSEDVCLAWLINDITHEEIKTLSLGNEALAQYRRDNYLLTAKDLKEGLLELVLADGKVKKPKVDDDLRCLIGRILIANEQSLMVDRRAAIMDTAKAWKELSDKDGEFTKKYVRMLQDQMGQTVPDDKIKRGEKTLTPDDIRNEKLEAAQLLRRLGVIKVDGKVVEFGIEAFNECMIECFSKANPALTIEALKQMDLQALTREQRKKVLAILDWPVTEATFQSKVWVLDHLKDILDTSDKTMTLTTKTKILAMLDPDNVAKGKGDGTDNFWVGGNADLHAAALRCLTVFGCQYVDTVTENGTKDKFYELNPDLKGKQLKLGTPCSWIGPDGKKQEGWVFMGEEEGKKGVFRLEKPGDPIVVTLRKHLTEYDLPSAQVRLAALESAEVLGIPGLYKIVCKLIEEELDVRVAQRLRGIRFVETRPLLPMSPESRDLVQGLGADITNSNEYPDMGSKDNPVEKWIKSQDDYKVLFGQGDQGYDKMRKDKVESVYSGWGRFTFVVDCVKGGFSYDIPNKKWDKAIDEAHKTYEEAFEKLYKEAATSDDKERRNMAILSLVWIVAKNGPDMPYRYRDWMVVQAINSLYKLAQEGSKERGAVVKWAIEKLLITQLDLEPGARMTLINAALLLADRKDDVMSKERLADIVYLTLRFECSYKGFPKPEEKEAYKAMQERHKLLVQILAFYCRSPKCVELLEAIAGDNVPALTHPDAEVRAEARKGVRFLRDGIMRNVLDAVTTPDKTSTAEQRRDAIAAALRNPDAEEVCRAIAKAVEGHPWNEVPANDELIRVVLRQATDDPRTRVRLMACYALFSIPQIKDKTWYSADYEMAAEKLYQITTTPYKLSTGDPSYPYYKEEAELILNFMDELKLPPEKKKALIETRDKALKRAKEKQEGYLANISAVDPKMDITKEEVYTRLNRELTRKDMSEAEVIRLMAIAQRKFPDLESSDTLVALYRQFANMDNARIRLAAGVNLVLVARDENDLAIGITALRKVATSDVRTSATADDYTKPTKLTKDQATEFLDKLTNRFILRGSLRIAEQTVLPSSETRDKQAIAIENLLGDANAATQVTRKILESAPAEKVGDKDPLLPVWRKALESKVPMIQVAAAMVLLRCSSNKDDIRASATFLSAVANSEGPHAKDAQVALSRFRQQLIDRDDKELLLLLDDAELEGKWNFKGLLGVKQSCKPINEGSIEERAAKLEKALEAANDKITTGNSMDACRAVFTYACPNGKFDPDSPIRKLIQDHAVMNKDERVKMACAWVLMLHGCSFEEDIHVGLMVLANMSVLSENGRTRIEANTILQSYKAFLQSAIDDEDTPKDMKKRAQDTIDLVDRLIKKAEDKKKKEAVKK